MNDQETKQKQWLANIYQQAVQGGELQYRALCGWTHKPNAGPCMESDSRDWRIKPVLKVIDMTPMIGSGLICEFWHDSYEDGPDLGALDEIEHLRHLPYAMSSGSLSSVSLWMCCQPLMSTKETPYIHFWRGGLRPVPEGFKGTLHLRDGRLIDLNDLACWLYNKERIHDSDVTGIEFTGIKNGYTLK
jgi:hypothetical protein